MSIKNYIKDQNWNIGFMQLTPARFVSESRLPKISWMKHDFHDRYFADPFILNVDNSNIEILAEELFLKKIAKEL